MRARAQRQEQRRVAELQNELRAVQERALAHHAALASAKQDLRTHLAGSGPSGGVTLLAVRLQAAAAFGLTAKARQAALELAGIHQRLEAARASLSRATTATRAVELLKQRRYDAWLEAQRRREHSVLDDISIAAAAARARRAGAEAGHLPEGTTP
ncbi:MAG TPA: flagellar FliJ family protein [Phycisphaerales bacterium]|nr:flagellar FliJ family protein [Phycisphaerales bacterium]